MSKPRFYLTVEIAGGCIHDIRGRIPDGMAVVVHDLDKDQDGEGCGERFAVAREAGGLANDATVATCLDIWFLNDWFSSLKSLKSPHGTVRIINEHKAVLFAANDRPLVCVIMPLARDRR